MQTTTLSNNKTALISIGAIAVALLILAFVFNGTGDEGDSITHYLLSKYAFVQPKNFLNHWAKPFFVLFSAPFAQFGFVGIKLFNIICTLTTLYFTYRSAIFLQIERPVLAIWLTMAAPAYAVLTLSGLTEPMFAAVLMASLYGIMTKRYVWALLVLSFLPFVRSEGLVIFGSVIIYLCYSKQCRYIPLLAFGHVAYSIIGYFYYHDFLWVFNKMPYATLSSGYGSGRLNHFFEKLPQITGDVLKALWIIGMIFGIKQLVQSVRNKKWLLSAEEIWLVYGCFVSYFVAHSMFWYMGIFNSYGLLRVMIGVLPLLALIALLGFNWLLTFAKPQHQKYLATSILIALFVLPFMGRKTWSSASFALKPDQLAQNTLYNYLKTQYPNYQSYYYYYSAPYLSLLFAQNFDGYVRGNMPQPNTRLPIDMANQTDNKAKPAFVIWDDWYAPTESNVSLEQISSDTTHWQLLKTFEEKKGQSEIRKTVLFISKP